MWCSTCIILYCIVLPLYWIVLHIILDRSMHYIGLMYTLYWVIPCIPYCIVLCIPYCVVLCIPYCVVLRIILCCSAHYTVLFYALYCIVLRIILCCSTHYTVLFYALYCIVLRIKLCCSTHHTVLFYALYCVVLLIILCCWTHYTVLFLHILFNHHAKFSTVYFFNYSKRPFVERFLYFENLQKRLKRFISYTILKSAIKKSY